MHSEIQTTEIKQIEIEINFYKGQAAQNIIEIGKRLIKAKELMGHGEWLPWIEKNVDFRRETARKFMLAAEEFGDSQAVGHLPQTKIFKLLELPKPERETFIEENPVEDMTTRELRQAIKDKKELEKKIEELENQEPTLIEKEVEIVPDDYNYYKRKHTEFSGRMDELQSMVRDLNRYVEDKKLELEKAESEKSILERKAKLNEKEASKYNKLTKDIENLTREKDDIGRQIQAKTELSGLVVRIEHILKTELAPVKYSRAINEVSTDEIVINNLRDIVNRVQDWCNEMYESTGDQNIIQVEVIDHE